ncbi:MAG: thioredoxin family protein [Flavobacteriaceae bacterium]|jgi:thioredoxin-related protein|nr:thioredoxin family protein [Flavobacteriaceae bacterium]MDG1774165.1 thioredoxin family protein [Flavobacteriaceae bacterium]MDG2415049.1 thioredoxin family protein [Flavobacteriaceae bacterium]
MKKIIYIALLFMAQFSVAQDWASSWSHATDSATSLNKPILLVFSGSDWCAPCIKLDRDIWTTAVFQSYAKKNLILYKADFPRRKANQLPEPLASENKELAAQYNTKGYFPLVVLLSPKKDILGQTAYLNISPEAYIEKLQDMAANE